MDNHKTCDRTTTTYLLLRGAEPWGNRFGGILPPTERTSLLRGAEPWGSRFGGKGPHGQGFRSTIRFQTGRIPIGRCSAADARLIKV